MNTTARLRTLALSVLLVFALSAIATAPVLADSGTTTPPPSTTGSTRTTSRSSSSNSLSRVPSGTKVVVLDSAGNKVPLGSQAAAAIVSSGDPLWCPNTVATPNSSGLSGCTLPADNLLDLITNISASVAKPNANGTIWISSYYQNGNLPDSSNSPIIINGLDTAHLGSWANFSLTLKGGWDGVGTSTVNGSSPSKFTMPIVVENWNNNVTVSDIIITNNTSNDAGEGLQISTTKNITLTRFQAYQNQGQGAVLDNSSGTGTITITDSQFFNNGAITAGTNYGLNINSKGAVTLNTVLAESNLYGAFIDNHSAALAQPVTIKDGSEFIGNTNAGLSVNSKGLITVTDLTASDNGTLTTSADGAAFDNSAGTANVVLTGTNIFDENSSDGLFIYSDGAITSGPISANDNGGNGALLDNSHAAALPVTLTGTSSFTGNKKYNGLTIYSKGAISVNNITADGNAQNGAYLKNDYTSTVASTIKATGTNWFSGNVDAGLSIASDGAVTLSNITATGNSLGTTTYDGLDINDPLAATAQGLTLTGSNTFSNNGRYGALIKVTGAVSLNNVTATSNGSSGVASGVGIENDYLGASKPQSVTLLGTNVLVSNYYDNLAMMTFGAIKINDLTADNSITGNGANLYYLDLDTTSSVTLTGTNHFDGNHLWGLIAESIGTITASNLNASSNGSNGSDNGVYIDNSSASPAKTVTLTGMNTFNDNYGTDLYVLSSGAITISSLAAISSQHGDGVDLTNNTGTGGVTLTGSNWIDNNYGAGLNILSKGAITINNLDAESNIQSFGATLDNHTGTAGVTLTGINTFSYNFRDGLDISTSGAITLSNLTAHENTDGFGVALNNMTGTAGVTLTGTNLFNFNFDEGLIIRSKGSITASNLNAGANGDLVSASNNYGVEIDNTFGTGNVTLTGNNTFNANYSDGLSIASNGVIKTNNLSADSNGEGDAGAYGVWIDNSEGTPKPVTLNGDNTFNNSAMGGLSVTSLGAIAINNLTANGTMNGYGAELINNTGTAGVTLTGNNTFNSDTDEGLQIKSQGSITVSNLTASLNGNASDTTDTSAVELDNTSGTGNVTLSGNNTFFSNYWIGLSIFSHGKVTTNNLTAYSNDIAETIAAGVQIENDGATPKSVTLNGVNTFNNNNAYGVWVESLGAITASNITANGNAVGGYFLNNETNAVGGINLTGNNVFLSNDVGLQLFSKGAVSLDHMTSNFNGGNGMEVDTTGNVTVTCGWFMMNGITDLNGYGWKTSSSVPSITLIGVDSAGNYSGPYSASGGTAVNYFGSRTCTLP